MRRGILLLGLLAAGCEEQPFAPARLQTASGKRADPDAFFPAADCGECHEEQHE